MYEQSREQRIKENQQRMEKLGILHLSRNLKPPPKRLTSNCTNPTQKPFAGAPPLYSSPRRSSRLKAKAPVRYIDKHKLRKMENVDISMKEFSKPEVYTEVHVKLLGDCKTNWTLFVEGYTLDGKRMFPSSNRKYCHQCRYKTLGHHTKCSKCKSAQGQLCGDCLYMRYGENVVEANENNDWVCPVCRGICNCCHCRRANGWRPTGPIFPKVVNLGFKSVAHYLIQTWGPRANQEVSAGAGSVSLEKSLPQLCDKKDEYVEISIKSDSKTEVYTEEHLKLLGDCKTSWTLHMDGFGNDGKLIKHSSEGKYCHQCSLKTLRHHTKCSKCKSDRGQLCGDCLYTRYGENIIEANENKDWVCPACRGICNCSVCRRAKGWRPTGSGVTYRKVTSLGFKSVAHYLILTRGPLGNQLRLAGASYVSGENSLSKLLPQLDKKKDENMKVVRIRKHICYDSESDEIDKDDDDELTEDAHDSDYEPDEKDAADDEMTEEE